MLDPIWDPQVVIFGIPARVFLFAIVLLGNAIGLLWTRRITRGDEEVQSFLATADRGRGPGWISILALAVLGLVVVWGTAVVVVLQPDPPAHGPFEYLAYFGALLVCVAALLGVRRAWIRFAG